MNEEKLIDACDCLMITGMHRSGSSLLAGCLLHLGINLGTSRLAGNSSNGGDTFENPDIVLAHEILFRDLGCRWEMVGELPAGWLESEAAERTGQKLVHIIQEQFLDHGPWAVKDPRLCRVLPLWSKVLAQLGVTPCFVHMVRHPDEVAGSLSQNHGMEPDKARLLWLVYNLDAFRDSRRQPRMLLTYDQLLADPLTALRRISDAFNLGLPCDSPEYSRTLTEFVRPEFKHHHIGGAASDAKNESAQYARVYDYFRLNQGRAIDPQDAHSWIRGSEMLADFPLVGTRDSGPQERKGHIHAAEMFNTLLRMIGRYEQAELDQELQRQRRLLAATQVAETLYAQVYFPTHGAKDPGYTEENSRKMLLAPNEWQAVTWEITRPQDLQTGRLRLDLLNTRGTVSVSSIKLAHAVTGEIYWAAEDPDRFKTCTVKGDGFVLPDEKVLTVVCTGNDAGLQLPILPDLPDCPMHLKVWLKPSRQQALLEKAWTRLSSDAAVLNRSLKETRVDLAQARDRGADLKRQLDETAASQRAKEQQLQALSAQHSVQRNQIETLRHERQTAEQSIQSLKKDLQARDGEVAAQSRHIDTLQHRITDQEADAKRLDREYQVRLEQARQKNSEMKVQLDEKGATFEAREKEWLVQGALQQQKIKNLLRQQSDTGDTLQTLKNELQIKTDELSRRIEKERQREADQQDRIEVLQRQLADKESALAARNSEYKTQLEQADLQREKNDTLNTEIAVKAHTIGLLEKQLESQELLSRQYYTALLNVEQKYQDRIEAKDSAWAEQTALLQAELDAREQERTESEHALQALKKELQSKTTGFSMLLKEQRRQNIVLHDQAQALKRRINQKDALFLTRLKAWQDQIETLRVQYTDTEKSFRALLDDLQAKADEQNALLQDERGQKNDLLNQRNTLERELKEKKAALAGGKAQMQAIERQNKAQVDALETQIADKDYSIASLEQKLKSQEELTRQYYIALQETEEAHQKQIQALNSQIRQKEDALESLVDQYHNERSAVEKERGKNRRLGETNAQLTTWVSELKVAFEALTAARRWKFACRAGRVFEVMRLRPKSPTAVDKIQGIFGLFEHTPQPCGEPVPQTGSAGTSDGELLFSWMRQLHRDFPAFVGSRRWRLGNAVIRLAEMSLLRPKVLLAPEHMAGVFEAFQHWQDTHLPGRQATSLYPSEVDKLHEWLKLLDNDFQATLVCRRWRFGSAVVRTLKRLAFQPQGPLVTDHMQAILQDYRRLYR